MQDWSEGGEAVQYSPGPSSVLTQIVPYSASLYTVFHSVIYNSVTIAEIRISNNVFRSRSVFGRLICITPPGQIVA